MAEFFELCLRYGKRKCSSSPRPPWRFSLHIGFHPQGYIILWCKINFCSTCLHLAAVSASVGYRPTTKHLHYWSRWLQGQLIKCHWHKCNCSQMSIQSMPPRFCHSTAWDSMDLQRIYIKTVYQPYWMLMRLLPLSLYSTFRASLKAIQLIWLYWLLDICLSHDGPKAEEVEGPKNGSQTMFTVCYLCYAHYVTWSVDYRVYDYVTFDLLRSAT